jgi:hypothetical protein
MLGLSPILTQSTGMRSANSVVSATVVKVHDDRIQKHPTGDIFVPSALNLVKPLRRIKRQAVFQSENLGRTTV